MKLKVYLKTFATIAILIVGSATLAAAQDQSQIGGTVTDNNGAIVPGATVKAINQATGESRTAVINDEGSFVIPNLKAGKYTVNATATNFATAKQADVNLLAGQHLNLEFKLPAQGVAVQVDVVSGQDTIANTSSASLGANVTQREVEGLPLNGRQLSQLALQAPGAQNSGGGTFVDLRFNGRANEQNAVRYDGIEGSAIISASPGDLNGEVATPFRLQSSLENVQEFRVESSNFPAEFGSGTGAQISVVTKSGSNQFHGSAFEFLRRDALDAANFFDNLNTIGLKKSPLQLDQFGGSAGGPIIKDKLFFFGSYEQYRGRFNINTLQAAPITNISTLCAPPIGTNPTGFNCQQAGAAPGTPSPTLAFLSAFRAPGAVTIGPSSPGFEQVLLQAPEKTDEKSFAVRFDYQANAKNRIYVRFFRDQGTDFAPNGVSGATIAIRDIPQNGVADWQSLLRTDGSLINDFKFGYNSALSRINGQAPIVNGLDLTNISLSIGGSVAVQNLPGQGTASGVSTPGGLVRANSAQNGRGQPYTPYSLSFIDSLSWIKGNHNIKFGGEFRLVRLYTDRLGGTTYTFSSLTNFLTNTLASVQYLGDVSQPSPLTTGPGGVRLEKQAYYIAYAQDEWKIRPGLTLNYGLRYEYYSPLHEAHDQQVLFNIDNGTLKPQTQDAYKGAKDNFGPRVALTWSPDIGGKGFFAGGNTILRTGFGIYYGPGQTEDLIQPIDSDRASSTVTGSVCSNGQNVNPCPAGTVQLFAFPAPVAANSSTITNFFNSNPNNRSYQPRAYSNNYTVPERIYQYSVSWQQQLPGKFTSTVAYVGSQGRNLFLRSVANRILPGQTTIQNGTNLPSGVGVVNRTDPVTGQVVAVNTIRQFSIVSGSSSVQNPFAEIDYKTSGGQDSYNALQVSVQRTFNTGVTMNSQYTFAKSGGNTAGSNEARTSAQLENFDADIGRNSFDVRHNFNASVLYDLPIGKGRHWDMGNTGNAVLGGWDIGGIFNARSGVPVEILVVRPDVVIQCQLAAGCPNGNGGTFANGFVAQLPTLNGSFPALPTGFFAVVNTPGGGASRNIRRPDLIPGVNPFLSVPGVDRSFINPAAFAAPAPGQFGNLTRNRFSGPIFRQFDFTLAKRFKFTETMNFEFRAEFFNILNQANFANPGTTLNLALPTLGFNVASNSSSACKDSLGNPLPAGTFCSTGTNLQPGQAYTQGAAGGTFGVETSTVSRTVGMGANRQIQFVFRFNF